MQRASVMAAHWCHLQHMGGNKHFISVWGKSTWLINNATNLRFDPGPSWLNTSAQRHSDMLLDAQMCVLRGFVTSSETAEWKQTVTKTAGETPDCHWLLSAHSCSTRWRAGYDVWCEPSEATCITAVCVSLFPLNCHVNCNISASLSCGGKLQPQLTWI